MINALKMSSVYKQVSGDSTKASCQSSQFEHIPKNSWEIKSGRCKISIWTQM